MFYRLLPGNILADGLRFIASDSFLEKGIYFNIPASTWNYAYSCMLLHRSTSQAQRKEIRSQKQVQNHRKAILLLKDHPFEAKISIDVVSSRQQPIRTWGRSSSFYSNAQKRIQWVPRKITCRGVTARKLLETISFLLNQIANIRQMLQPKFCT